MPSRKIEQQLDALKSLRGTAVTEATLAALKKALSDRVNLVIAKAAALTAELQLQALVPDLLNAFERLFEDAAKADPQCWGKNALSKALKDLGYDESAAFLRGLQHVQMEPVWGKEVDTAGTLRAICVLALLQCADLTRQDKLWHLMRALTDAEANVRADAARALQELDGMEAALLLRLKARMGDREASVTGQVLESLLGIEREDAVSFVTEFLASRDEELREEAALSLGASRLPAAIAALIEQWRRNHASETSQALLRGISASRQQIAIDFLLDLVRNAGEHEALAALQVLELHRESAEIRKQIEVAVEKRGESGIRNAFRQRFPAK